MNSEKGLASPLRKQAAQERVVDAPPIGLGSGAVDYSLDKKLFPAPVFSPAINHARTLIVFTILDNSSGMQLPAAFDHRGEQLIAHLRRNAVPARVPIARK